MTTTQQAPVAQPTTETEPQEGIYYQRGVSPPGFFMLVALRARENATAWRVSEVLEKLWDVYGDLKKGMVPDLHRVPGGDQAALVPHGNLAVLIGFGERAFHLAGREESLVAKRLRNFPFEPAPVATPDVDTPIARGDGATPSAIPYAKGKLTNLTDVHFVFQFTADTALAVERAVVETWKVIHDERARQGCPLDIAGVFGGSQRDDYRSWIDFHDGLSNIAPADRRDVIFDSGEEEEDEAPEPVDEGVHRKDATFLAFIRVGIDLEQWRELCPPSAPETQELFVGRKKLTGCPLVRMENDVAIADPRCPSATPITDRRNAIHDNGRPSWWSPPEAPTDTTIQNSHMHRTNQREEDPDKIPSFRVFRQGYPYLAAFPDEPYFEAGLNFVSFQNSPKRLIGMLTTDTWLGATNFGGDDLNNLAPAEQGLSLLHAYAAGMFYVPPVVVPTPAAPAAARPEPFPGWRILEV